MDEPYRIFHETAADPWAYARRWKARTGGPVVGTLCTYAPEEIVVAGGGLPVRIFASGRDEQRADAHLQTYSCSLVRGALADRLAGRLDVLDGTVFPHSCDSIQRLSDIWRLQDPDRFHADVVWPVTVDRPGARAYAVAVLRQFAERFAAHFGAAVDPPALAAAAGTYNRLRRQLRRLHALRRDRPGSIAGRDFLAVMRAAMVMDRRAMSAALEPVLARLESAAAPATAARRLVLAGGVCNLPDIYDAVEAAGAVAVWDDLCTGHRYAEGEIDVAGGVDPWEALARRYLERTVCPAKHAGLTSRADALSAAARAARAAGVVLLYLKFCDPHLFDHPYLKGRLEADGLPTLMFEFEEQRFSEGQFRTRLEAFLEML